MRTYILCTLHLVVVVKHYKNRCQHNLLESITVVKMRGIGNSRRKKMYDRTKRKYNFVFSKYLTKSTSLEENKLRCRAWRKKISPVLAKNIVFSLTMVPHSERVRSTPTRSTTCSCKFPSDPTPSDFMFDCAISCRKVVAHIVFISMESMEWFQVIHITYHHPHHVYFPDDFLHFILIHAVSA